MAFSFYLEFIGLSITSVWFLDLDRVQYIVHVLWTPLFVAVAKISRQNILFIYIKAPSPCCYATHYLSQNRMWVA